jgi:hypothetical protein
LKESLQIALTSIGATQGEVDLKQKEIDDMHDEMMELEVKTLNPKP